MLESYFSPIDNYCERLGPEFWAEPLNAVTNGIFLVTAFLALRLARSRAPGVTFQAGTLIAMVAIIGVGSFLFHTLAVYWAMLADVIPISIYQILFLIFYCRTVVGLPAVQVVGYLVAFFVTSVAFGMLPHHWLNGSLSYGPALVFIAGLGIYHWRTHKREPFALLLAAGFFALSLTFRSLDMQLCDQWSIGTHLVWHLLNGVVLYLTTRGFVVNLEPNRISR